MKVSRIEQDAIETMIDSYGLNELCEIMAVICHEKAEHIQSSYSDSVTSDTWNRASVNLMVLSEFVFSRSITIRKG